MATVKGIQMRRGLEADFDPSKLNPGEFAVAVDTNRVWLCFASGVVKELGLLDDINAQLAAINQTLEECDGNAEEAVTKARQALANAQQSAASAEAAKTAAQNAQTSVASSAATAQQAAQTAQQAQAETAAANAKAENAENLAAEALEKANEALPLARTASTDSATALSRANTASADSATAVETSTAALSAANAANTKADNANRFATAANTKAETAQNNSIQANASAGNALAIAEGMDGRITQLEAALVNLRNVVDTKFDDAELTSEALLNFLANGQVVVGPLGPFAGGGGGGGGSSGNNAIIDAHNTTGGDGRNTITLASGAACPLTFTWSSLENEHPTGNGTMKIYVAGALRSTRNIAQGEVSVDVSQYLSAGNNAVTVQILDVYSNRKVFAFTVTVISLSLSSTFDASTPYAGAITFPYTPVGAVQKTVYFILDGQTLGTVSTSVSNRQQTYVIPAQQYGSHTLRVYFETELDNDTIRSNELYYEFISIGDGTGDPIITSSFNKTTMQQYSTALIDYTVYDPSSLTCDVVITVNGNTFQTVTVDRTTQSVSVRFDTVGTNTVVIRAGSTTKTFTITVEESDAVIEPVTDDLELHLTAYGRSNNESNPGTWVDGSTSCTFTNFEFVNDGWKSDEDGNTVLRTTGDARLTIPFQPFAADARSTGETIEIEFATRDVMDYDAEILSCMSGGKGLKITAQSAVFKSEQSEIDVLYKEEEHIRLSFVVEKKAKNRLVYVYINGIMSQVVQYPTDDDFQQASPVGITVGSSDATVDVYCIRVYSNDLSAHQIVDNWIADTQDIDEKLARFTRNNIFDAYGQVVIDKLPTNLPYYILEAPELPQYKGDKKTITGSYTDPASPGRSFTFEGCEIDVQGTSSAGYARKNYDMKFKKGFEMSNGSHADSYALASNVIPFNRFVLKADVASSESTNNTGLTMLFCDAVPYKTPEQVENPMVRQGIYGFPIVVFWRDTVNDTVTLLGKYNFNLPKRAAGPYGFHDNMESWEWQNNTSDRVLFKSADFTSTFVDEDGKTKYQWQNDFEARFPSDEWTNVTKLKEWLEWTVSTDRTAATNATLETPVTYEDVDYTTDSAAYRLAKFKDECADLVEMDSAIFYYIFTELFLMVDSRAKNMFPSFAGSAVTKTGSNIDRKVIFMPYDMDTGLGTNNEGTLTFGYSLEDIDTVGGADVFNGQQSVFWNNLRDAFPTQIRAMYKQLRADGILSYESVEGMYEDHQSYWPENIFNEDAEYKYIDPLINEGNKSYLSMLQGSKAEQRKWWLHNRFRYMDSKWNAGDALSDIITLRGYAKANITLTPYADIYPSIKFGSYLVQTRGQRKMSYTIQCPLDNVNDTETYIYAASQLQSIGDISPYQVGYADFSNGTRLTSLKVGDASSSYTNTNLKELHVGNLPLLKTIDVRNCPNLAQSVDLSGCVNLEKAYFSGTSVSGVQLANGAAIDTLVLPNTITNLTLRNLTKLSTLTVAGYSNVSTLWLEGNSNVVNTKTIFDAIATGARVRLLGIQWSISSNTSSFIEHLESMRGLDENGNNTQYAQLSGSIYFSTISSSQLQTMRDHYPNVTVSYGTLQYSVDMYSEDGSTLLKSNSVTAGANCPSYTPTKSSTAQYNYSFAGWATSPGGAVVSNALTNIREDKQLYAVFNATLRTYTVYFYNESTLLQTVNNVPYGGTANYTGSEPTKEGYEFSGWSPSNSNITGQTSCYAQFSLATLDVVEITDSWTEIIAACNNGTYKSKYNVGNYKPLTIGSETINMQIAGMDKDDLADGTGKAPISWVPKEPMANSHRWNADYESNYRYETGDSFKRYSTSSSNSNYNRWDAQNKYTANNTAKITIEATAVADGTLRLTYVTGSSSGNNTSLKVNGTEVVTSHSTSTQNYDLAITNGTTYTIEFETTRLTVSNTDDVYLKLCNTSGSGTNTNVSALVSQTAPVITDCTIRVFDHYTDGKGGVGGWEKAELRDYLRTTVLQSMPAEVQAAIKPVTKHQQSIDTSGNTVAQTTTETVWLPSYHEVFGGNLTGETATMPKYNVLFRDAKTRKKYKVGASSASSWWLRSANIISYAYNVSYTGNYNGDATSFTIAVCPSCCT